VRTALAAATAPQSILVLRAHVEREEAVETFTHGIAGGVRRLALGPLRSVADIYVPFRVYQVSVARARNEERLVLGLDAVAGALDLYRFDDVPRSEDTAHVRTRNRLDPVLSTSAAHGILTTRVKRIVYQRVGFLAAARFRLDVQPVDEMLHVPYWVGFFGRGEAASLVVMDAVRRQIEGVKVRRLIGEWLSE
jgi:hypothetical protein